MKLRPIHVDDYQMLKTHLARHQHPLSGYAVALLYEWNGVGGYEVKIGVRDDILFIGARNRLKPEISHLALPLPAESMSPRVLRQTAIELEFGIVGYVPETYFDLYSREQVERYFDVQSQPESHDYIYLASDLADLPGNGFAKKRNLIKQFEREWVEPGRTEIRPIDDQLIGPCREFLEAWCRERECDAPDRDLMAVEKQATLHALEKFELLELRGIAILVDNVISGMGIAAHLNQSTGVLNIQKAFASIKGLYQYLDRECARRLFVGHYEFINKESDMGVPGLGKSKRSYHPLKIVESFKLIPRSL